MAGRSGGDRLGSAVRWSLPVEQIANLILRLRLSAGDCAGSENPRYTQDICLACD